MSRRFARLVSTLFSASVALAGCGEAFSTGEGGTSGPGGSGATGTGTTSSSAGGGGAGSSVTTTGPAQGTSVGSGGGGMGPCGGVVDHDDDGDGVSEAQGDCDDCRADVGPSAMEVPGDEVDDDCDGDLVGNRMPCDGGFSIGSQDPFEAAKTIGLCKPASEGWGLVDAQWLLPDGSPWAALDLAFQEPYHRGHGILPDFGSLMHVQEGQRLLALSSGSARRPLDVGYVPPAGFSKGYEHGAPSGYPKDWPSCPGAGVVDTSLDGVALQVVVRVPVNAHGLRFDFAFYAWDFPTFLCTQYNDYFTAILSPKPAGLQDGNTCFDATGTTMGVNADILRACKPQTYNAVSYACPLGQALLGGSGYDDAVNGYGVSSAWMRTQAPVEPGDTITLLFAVWDSTDGSYDSTTLVDNVVFETAGLATSTDPIANPL